MRQANVVWVVVSKDEQEISKRLMINNSQTIQAPKAHFPEDSETMAMTMNNE
jgi:hypothetical protein